MPVVPGPARSAPPLLATPDELDEIAWRTVELARRVEDVAVAVQAVLRDLTPALPGSATSTAAPAAGGSLAELLTAEGTALRDFGQGLAKAAADYRDNDRALAARMAGGR